jgi:hypothetical protein
MLYRRLVVSVLGILLALPILSTSAQTPAANSIPDEEDLIGLQAAVWRTYMPAGTFTGQGRIDLDEATPVTSPLDTILPAPITVVVREFDTAENAATAYAQISSGVEASMPDVFSDGTPEVTSEALPGVGSQAILIRVDVEFADQRGAVWMENVIVQRDQYVFFVLAQASILMGMPEAESTDLSLPTVDIASAVASGEPSPDEPEFRDDGTSTGGLWGFMPPAGDPLLMGLVPIQDVVVFPNSGP